MGDLMHALPALTDATDKYPGVTFDWVVDESFAEVPSWHPAVRTIIPSAHRRWRGEFLKSIRNNEFARFYRRLNQEPYDLVIDAQNNIKSAFISLLRKGPVHGMDKTSVPEQPAHLAYKYRHCVDIRWHAITRQRALFAQAMGYEVPDNDPDYGLRQDAFARSDIPIKTPYLVFVHNASWSTKLWPESHWHELIRVAARQGYQVALPGGSNAELARAKALAKAHDNAIALPRMSLSELGGLIRDAHGAVNCDTGLAHLTAMLGTPAVTLYGPTSASLIGTTGQYQQQLVATDPPFYCAPCYKRQCDFEGGNSAMSACMKGLSVETAWEMLAQEMGARETARKARENLNSARSSASESPTG